MTKQNLVMGLSGGVLLLLLVWASLATRGLMLMLLIPPIIGLMLWLDLLVRGDRWAWYALAVLSALASIYCLLGLVIFLFDTFRAQPNEFYSSRLGHLAPQETVSTTQWAVMALAVGAFLITLRLLLSDRPSNWPGV